MQLDRRATRTSRALVAACVLVALVTPRDTNVAQAHEGSARSLEQTSDFWREVRQPGFTRAQNLLRQGERMLQRAARLDDQPARRAALLRSAILRFEAALRILPDDPYLLFALARTEVAFELPLADGTSERMDHQAIAHYQQLREAHPNFRVEYITADLGTAYSRIERLDLAIGAYEESIRSSLSVVSTANTYSNLAETRMMTGDLLGGVRDYERAIELAQMNANFDPRTLALPLFGLAVALERLGEHRGALERANEAMSVAGNSMEVLRADGVFFEPEAEIHFYEGLAHLALEDAALEPSVKATHRHHAHASWRAYVRLAADDDPWKTLAQEHVDATRPD